MLRFNVFDTKGECFATNIPFPIIIRTGDIVKIKITEGEKSKPFKVTSAIFHGTYEDWIDEDDIIHILVVEPYPNRLLFPDKENNRELNELM